MRYYHRPLAHTTFIIHFSLTLKWTLNCTNIWTLKWTRLRHFLLSMRDTQSESDHNILPQTRTRKIILSIEHHIIVSSQKTNIRVPYNTNIHLWYFLIDVEMKTKLLIICPAVRFIRRSIHEYLDHGIRVGASIQEQLNHLQMTLHSGDDERSCYSGPILWETGWETRWETRRHQNKLNYAETIRIGLERIGPSVRTQSAAFGSAPLSRSNSTTCRWPSTAERIRAAYERQTNIIEFLSYTISENRRQKQNRLRSSNIRVGASLEEQLNHCQTTPGSRG